MISRRSFLRSALAFIGGIATGGLKPGVAEAETEGSTINVGSSANIDDLPDGEWGPWNGLAWDIKMNGWDSRPSYSAGLPVTGDMRGLWNLADGLWFCERTDRRLSWFVWGGAVWHEFSMDALPQWLEQELLARGYMPIRHENGNLYLGDLP